MKQRATKKQGGAGFTREEERAFAAFYENTRRLAFAVAFSVTCNARDAEEITQDSYVALWEKYSEALRFAFQYGRKHEKELKNLLAKIAKNKALNLIKKRRREQSVDFTSYEPPGLAYSVDERVEDGAALAAAAASLTQTEREIVLMKNAGAKMREIAGTLGIPRGTASWKYTKALEKLRRELEGTT
ncbi:MAG: sigma-70 family RNA polymerase sigma factor [Candidatus Borkfalkiaceae bacterium]|nr:sigma-70 family RNA polymerase sigma factor [Clostridia bacterium]MDY6223342.1 sigma-70 family RNA polymerase sigma factor [Christensenellaceae bacterium]